MIKISSLSNKTCLKIWGIYHIGITALFLILLLIGKRSINIDADLFNMLPKPVASEAISAADEKLTETTGQNVFILVSNPDFDECKKSAEKVYNQLKDSGHCRWRVNVHRLSLWAERNRKIVIPPPQATA